MRLDIRYRMHFDYPDVVREAHNEIRVRPRDLPTQRLLAHRLTCVPASRVLSFTDYWGTTVDHVGQVSEHDVLEIVAEADTWHDARDRLTVFDSTGWALEDHVAVEMLLERATELGIGTNVQLEHVPRDPLDPYDI